MAFSCHLFWATPALVQSSYSLFLLARPVIAASLSPFLFDSMFLGSPVPSLLQNTTPDLALAAAVTSHSV